MILAMSACGGKTKKRNISEDPQRSGSSLSAVDVKYNDFQPNLSADGTRVVFLSGRDSAPGKPTHKAYKVDWAVGAAPGAPARVTDADLGIEKDATISDDGAWIALVGALAGKPDVYVVPAAATTAVRVGDDSTYKAAPAFSPDGKLLAWIAKGTDGIATLKVVPVGAGAEADLAAANHVVVASDNVQAFAWAPTGDATYALVSGASEYSQGRLTYVIRRFAAIADAAAATPTTLAEDILPPKGMGIAATDTVALLARRTLAYEARQVEIIGDREYTAEAPAPKVAMNSDTVTVALAGGDPTALLAKPGTQTLSLAAGTGAAFAAMRFFYGCKDEGDLYGAGLVVAPLDGTEPQILLPRLKEVVSDAELKFDVAVGFCDRLKTADKPEDGKWRLDDKILSAAVARSGTATKFRVAYVSQFSPRFDAECILRSGDQEIMVLDVDGDTRTVQQLSANRVALKDAPHDPPCAL